jgi:hypothetical protein
MWWSASRDGHASCQRQLAKLADRLDMLEERVAANRLELLDTAEKVAEKLVDRRRKREAKTTEPESVGDLLAKARRAYALHAG